MKRFLGRTTLLLAVTAVFMVCAGTAPALAASVRTLNLSTLAPLTTIDPHNTTNQQDINFHKQVFEPLFFQNEATGVFHPRVAESYSVSSDGLSYTFNIRQSAKFHNGKDVKASDVVFSFKRAAENPKVRNYLTTMVDVAATGDYTVVQIETAQCGFFERPKHDLHRKSGRSRRTG